MARKKRENDNKIDNIGNSENPDNLENMAVTEKNEPVEAAEPAEPAEETAVSEMPKPIEDVEELSPAKHQREIKIKNGSGMGNSIWGTAAILGCIIVVTVFVLAAVNYMTAPVIEKRLNEGKEELIISLFGEGKEYEILSGFEDLYLNFSAQVTEVAVVSDKTTQGLVGYCVTVSPQGFADRIVMLVAVNPNIMVQDTKILSMNETAGQGTKIASEEWFGEQFRHKTKDIKHGKTAPSSGENAIMTIAGATVSSRAFLDGVNAALDIVGEITGR